MCLPTLLKKRRTHHQFLNHVFWLSREIEKRPSEVWKPKKPYSKRDKQKWDGGWVQKLAVKELSQNDFLTRIEKWNSRRRNSRRKYLRYIFKRRILKYRKTLSELTVPQSWIRMLTYVYLWGKVLTNTQRTT